MVGGEDGKEMGGGEKEGIPCMGWRLLVDFFFRVGFLCLEW